MSMHEVLHAPTPAVNGRSHLLRFPSEVARIVGVFEQFPKGSAGDGRM